MRGSVGSGCVRALAGVLFVHAAERGLESSALPGSVIPETRYTRPLEISQAGTRYSFEAGD